MNQIQDLPLYFADYLKYNKFCKRLYWFQKNKGHKWIHGQNFGDYLSVVIIGELAYNFGFVKINETITSKLFAVGSILHYAENDTIIWGSGVNGKISESRYNFNRLDVRMVRGPKTKIFLQELGIQVGDVFGDPGSLLPYLFPELKWEPRIGKITVLPNFNEFSICKSIVPQNYKLISPLGYWKDVVLNILTSELVLTSSLHGLIVAEAFGVPVRFVMPFGGETLFKYQDYFLGTGRNLEVTPSRFCDGISADIGITMPSPVFNIRAMLESFPKDQFIS